MINENLVTDSQVLQAEDNGKFMWNLLLNVLGIVLFGALAAFGKKATLNLGIPGHSAIFWLGAMVAGRAIINKSGAGLSIGIMTAMWGVPLGLSHSLVYNIGIYGAAGVAIDIVAQAPFLDIRKPLAMIVAGIVSHMVKFCFIIGKAMTSVTVKHFLIFGMLKSATLHLVFGFIAGLAAFGIVAFYSLAKDKISNRRNAD